MVGVYYFLSFFLMNAVKAPHHPRGRKRQKSVVALSPEEHKKMHNVSQDPGDKPVTKTVREWAEIVKEREDERQKRYKADDRVLAYQEENGKLHLELLKQRIGSLLIGIGVGLSLAVCILEIWK